MYSTIEILSQHSR